MDEAAVVEGCRRGDRAAQRAFYEQHADRIYALTLRMTGRAEDAFDLTQDTFLRAFQQFANFDARAAAGTWLYRIAVNETLQFFRRRDRERAHLETSRSEATGRTDDEAAAPAAPAETDVSAALADLSLEHRAVLILKYQTGLDYAEIAEVLDCAPGTVASRLNRARSELRRLLEARAAGEEPRRVGHPTSRR
ncbi:MAG: ECF RNA polymerase sigma factor SigW [Phycisphaerae bacterium]|nr:ECF RNA polymerase sigma factor SigW [Phycisphaerae bacterium]